MANYTASLEVLNSEKRRAVNIGNHADLWLLKTYHNSVNSTLLIISISSNTSYSAPQKHRAWSKERSTVSQWTKILRVHNSHEPLESRALKIIFSVSSLLSVEDKSSLSETTAKSAKCRPQGVVLSPIALCKFPGEEGAVTLQKILRKSFHPFAPLEVTLAFSDQGHEYYKIHKTYTAVASSRGKEMSQRSSIPCYSLRRSLQFSIRLREENFYNM